MPDLPSGTVTFVFSDLEGSTRLLKQLGDEKFTELLATHRRLVRETFAEHGGSEIDTQGDAFFYSFARARAAVAAAVELQRRHASQEWPGGVSVEVRLGLHTGEPVVGEEGYTGLDVVRAARIAADGRGGQILLSEATRAIVGGNLPDGVRIRELGERTLKDIDRPEPLFEVVYRPDSPAPTETSLPVAAPPAPPQPTQPMKYEIDTRGLMKGWRELAQSALDEVAANARSEATDQHDRKGGRRHEWDPGKAIEERVLAQLRAAFRAEGEPAPGGKPDAESIPAPPKPPQPSASSTPEHTGVADEIARLAELRDSGALTPEQYSRAVDRLLDRG